MPNALYFACSLQTESCVRPENRSGNFLYLFLSAGVAAGGRDA
jgi:hypothetical protein